MKKLSTIFVLIVLAQISIAQKVNVREEVYLQVNSDNFITGETLYFSAFVTSSATSRLSDLSSIVYVELVGEDRVVFQQKIQLKNGRGYGEFFMPSLVSTGTYHLIAYTRWMKNFESLFRRKITVINPFEEYEKPAQGSQLNAVFYPESGGLVVGRENNMVFRFAKGLQGVMLKGKVVNTAGDKLADIQSSAQGIGQFSIVPKEGESYQAIMEDEQGDFLFFNLPATLSDMAIHVEEDASYFSITVLNKERKLVQLSVSDGQNQVYDEEVETNSEVRLYKKNLNTGAYIASSGDAERIFTFIDQDKSPNQSIEKFQIRDLVQVPIQAKEITQASVSVRKNSSISSIDIKQKSLLNNLNQDLENPNNADIGLSAEWRGTKYVDQSSFIKYLPEVRGELISGKINGSFDEKAETIVTFSTIGQNYQLRTAAPDSEGSFVLQIDPIVGEHLSYLAILNGDSATSLEMESPFLKEYPDFEYVAVNIDSATAVELAERSVRNQIQNAYYEFDPQEDDEVDLTPEQFGEFSRHYVLDDYNRFPKMHEHFIEFIPEVVARQNSSRSKIKVLSRYLLPYDLDPLILVDGVPTTAERILSFSPYKVKSIGVINNRIFNGPLIADGLVSFHTFQGDLHTFNPGDNGLKFTHQGVEPKRDYSFPTYESKDRTSNRLPDFRDQLYWNPEVTIAPEQPYLLEFYTSDTEGIFEILVEGIDSKGQPFVFKKLIEVNPPASN
ncbi:MAG: hypothetical protein RIC35_00645 [Marinoscillum sp.]